MRFKVHAVLVGSGATYLRNVRELLKLDRGYYSTTDDSLLRETFSKMKVARRQVLLRPTLLRDAVRALSLKALYLPTRSVSCSTRTCLSLSTAGTRRTRSRTTRGTLR